MNTKAAFLVIRPIQCAAVVALLLVSSLRSHAQRQGSRPIEFSQPRDKGTQHTNSQEFGAERRRLTDLEDRLSKTFNFFDVEDSMSGAPAPRPVRRARVVSTRPKPKSLFEEDDHLSSSDPLARLRDLMESEGSVADELDPSSPMDPSDDGLNLLESLKADDWLVKGTMSESFWEMPLVSNPGSDEFSPNEDEPSSYSPPQNWGADNGVNPQLEDLMGRDRSRISPFGNRQAGGHPFSGGDGFGLGQPPHSTIDGRRSEYRAFSGLADQTDPRQAIVPTTSWNSSPLPDQHAPTSVTRGNVQAKSRPSLYPMRQANHDSLYPTAPTAPQRPSVFDPIEVEQPVSSASAPASVLSDPFYRAPQRQF